MKWFSTRKMKMSRVLILAGTFAAGCALHAATYTWDANGGGAGTGGTGTWDTTTSLWDNGGLTTWPATGTDHVAVFGGTSGTVSIAPGGVSANQLSFQTTGCTVQNNTLTLNGATPTITVGSGLGADINSVLAGTAGMVKAGPGTLTLGGANTLDGPTTISDGTLNINAVGSGSNNGNTGVGAGTQLITSALTVSSGATVVLNTGTSFSSANGGTTLSGPGTIRLGSGTWWLGNAGGGTTISMSAGGLIDIQGGTMKNDYANANWSANQGGLNVASGANFDLRNNNVTVGALTGGGAVFDAGFTNTLTVGAGDASGTFSGTIGPGGTGVLLTKTGTGTQILTGANTYAGVTTVSNGTLRIGAGGSVGAIAGGAVSVASPGRITWDNNNDPALYAVANNISGTGEVLLQGYNATGAINYSIYEFTGNNSSFSGKLVLNRSMAWNNNAASRLGTAEITVQDQATIAFNGSAFTNNIKVENGAGWHHNVGGDVVLGAIRLEGNNTLDGNIQLNQSTGVVLGDNTGANSTLGGWAAGNHTFSGVISGTGELSMSRLTSWNGGAVQAVNIDLTGASSNTYTGKTVVDGQGGVASLRLGKTGGAVAIQGGTTVQFGIATGGQANLRMLQGNQFGTNNGGVLLDFVNASGQWMRFDLLGTTQTVAGIMTGTLAAQGSGVIQNGGLGLAGAAPATLVLNVESADPRYPVGGYVYNGHLRNQDNVASSAFNVVKQGDGVQTLIGGVVTYTGATTVSGGELYLRDTTGFASASIDNGATVRMYAGGSAFGVAGTKTGAGTWIIDGPGGGTAFDNRVILRGDGSAMSGVVNVVNSGKLWLDRGVNAIGDSVPVDVGAGASFYLYANAGSDASGSFLVEETIGGLSGSGLVHSYQQGGASGPQLTVGGGDATATFSGNIGEAPGSIAGFRITKTGAGTQTFSGNNTYSGVTTISGGVLQIGDGGATGTLGTGPVVNNAALVINRSNAVTVAGAISGLGTFTQAGAGTTTLSGGNTYAGTTYVNQGALILDGSTDSAGRIDVSSGATLGGGGTGGIVTVADGGIFAPGGADNDIELASLTLSGTPVLKFDVDAPSVTPSFYNDYANITGALVLNGLIQVGPQPGALGYDFMTAVAGDKWLVMSYTGALGGSGLAVAGAPALAPGLSMVVDTATAGSVFLAVVPESGTGSLVLLGLALLLRRLFPATGNTSSKTFRSPE